MRRVVVWQKEDGYGVELAHLTLEVDRMSAGGVAVGWHPVPYRLDYLLTTDETWVTRRLIAESSGAGWRRSIDLERAHAGPWSITATEDGTVELEPAGGEVEGLADALDCDLGLSPLTNSMPVLRHGLLEADGTHDFLMAWVAVPALALHASKQRYTTLGGARSARRIEYRSLESAFVSQLTFDQDGVVVDYPQLGRRVGVEAAGPPRRGRNTRASPAS